MPQTAATPLASPAVLARAAGGLRTAPRRWIATLIVGLWTVVGLAVTQVQVLSFAQADVPADIGPFLRWNLWSVWLWAAFTPAIVLLSRRFPVTWRTWPRSVPVHLAATIGFAALDALANSLAAPLFFPFPRVPDFREFFLQQLLVNQASYLIVAALAHVQRYAALYHEREMASAQIEAQLASARLLALRAQLHPHFLFNTLNAIAEQVHRDPDAADAMITRLGALLRATLKTSEAAEVPLRDELDLTGDYLDLMRARFGERLRVRRSVPPDLLDARVPAFVLQPLVENALRHGIERRVTAGLIEVSAREHAGELVLEISDDGAGLPTAPVDGVGLRNTRARLRHLHGDAATLTLSSRPGGGTTAMLAMPLKREHP